MARHPRRFLIATALSLALLGLPSRSLDAQPAPDASAEAMNAQLAAEHVARVGPSYLYPAHAVAPGLVNPDITQANIHQTIGSPPGRPRPSARRRPTRATSSNSSSPTPPTRTRRTTRRITSSRSSWAATRATRGTSGPSVGGRLPSRSQPGALSRRTWSGRRARTQRRTRSIARSAPAP